MVVIRLLERNDEIATYEYLPEGRKSRGVVSFDRIKKQRIIVRRAAMYSDSYAFHALKRIEEFDCLGEFKEEDMIVWY